MQRSMFRNLDPPVQPAVTGTYRIAPLNADYSAGPREIVRPILGRLLKNGGPVAVDIETFGLGADARRIKCVGLANEREAVVLDPRDHAQADLLYGFFGRADTLVFHNAAFDVPNMHVFGLWERDWCAKVLDTMIYARLAHPDNRIPKKLESLAERYLGVKTDVTIERIFAQLGMTKTEGFRRMDLNTPIYLMSNAVDALATARLLKLVRAAARDKLTTGHPFSSMGVTGAEADRLVEREQVINRMMLRRACKGVRVDLEFLDSYRDTNDKRRDAAEADLSMNGVRPGNAGDLIKLLERQDALPASHPRTPKTGRPSTTAENLELIAHPLAELFVSHKKIVKIEDDYLQKCADLEVNGRVHPTLNLLAATHGRASMGDPPFHQFPEAARGMVLADEDDALSSIDWSQIEPVTGANLAKDEKALAGYESGKSDFYTDISALAVVSRDISKVIVLAYMYGEGLRKLAFDLRVDRDHAEKLQQSVARAMPKTIRMLFLLKQIATEHRKTFTLSGRILDIPMGRGFDGGPPTPAAHKGPNYTICGSAYDILAEALVNIDNAGLGDAVYLTMHDEIICSTSAAHDIDMIMRQPPDRLCELSKRVPVLRTDRADLGERWAKA